MLRKVLCMAFAGAMAAASADTICGVVSDSLNGMLLDSVKVSAEGVTALTDAKGAFSLDLSGAAARFVAPRNLPLTWDAAAGAFSWSGYTGELSIAVHSVQGAVVERASGGNGPSGSTFSVADLPQGIYTIVFQTPGDRSVYRVGSLKTDRQRFSLSTRSRTLAKGAAGAGNYSLTFTKSNFDTKTMPVSGAQCGLAVKMKSPYPLKNILKLFLDPSIPATGPKEAPATVRKWTTPSAPSQLLGGGIARHDMVMVGEGYRRINIIIGGKLAWEYDTKDEAELDDVWVLSNGNVLFAHMHYIEEVTPKKEVVWHYDPSPGEIHTCQPIGLDKVLFAENGSPVTHIKLYNKVTKTFEMDKAVDSLGGTQHVQCRRIRDTGHGTYIAASLGNRVVYGFDKDWKIIWRYRPEGSAWSGVPLKNGNVIIQDEAKRTTLEVDPQEKVVWKLVQSEIMLPAGVTTANTQTCERLSNGNTVVFSGGTKVTNLQAMEVTPAKEAARFLQDWVNLGDATTAQFLDEPGYPEVPGQTNH